MAQTHNLTIIMSDLTVADADEPDADADKPKIPKSSNHPPLAGAGFVMVDQTPRYIPDRPEPIPAVSVSGVDVPTCYGNS